MDLINFAKFVGKSKKIKRAGWVREGIKNSETVAEHCFRLSVLSMVLAPQLGLDQNKLMKMALIHDLGEIRTGDIVVERGRQIDLKMREEKEKLEKQIVEDVLSKFEREYVAVFEEMVRRETEEAKIFWQLDKLEMVTQALEYEEEQQKDLTEFFDNAKLHIKHPVLLKILEDMETRRPSKKS